MSFYVTKGHVLNDNMPPFIMREVAYWQMLGLQHVSTSPLDRASFLRRTASAKGMIQVDYALDFIKGVISLGQFGL